MVGQQVGGHTERPLEFRRRGVPERQRVGDREPGRLREGRMQRGPSPQLVVHLKFHCLNFD